MDVMALRMTSPAQCHVRCTCLTSARLTYVHGVENMHHLFATRVPSEAVGAPAKQSFESDAGNRRVVTKAFISSGRKLLFGDTVSILIGRGVMSHGPLARNSLLCSRIHCRHFY